MTDSLPTTASEGSPARSPAPRSKRRFDLSQIDIQPPRQPRNDPATTEILVCLHPWGNASFVFKQLAQQANWRSEENTLWQARIFHNARAGFGYMLTQNTTAALREHPNPLLRTLKSHETHTHIRILTGAPPVSEDPDPDGLGFVPWEPVVYGAGQTPAAILHFIHFLAVHRKTSGQWTEVPPLIARIKAWPRHRPPPLPWQLREQPNMNLIPCFRAVPPSNRQHVLCQVEYIHAPKSHALTFYGNLRPYLKLFNKENTPAGSIPAKDSMGKPMYVRHLQVNADGQDKLRVLSVLQNVLCKLPVYLIDATEREEDEMSAWLAAQENVILAETYM